MSGKVSVIMPSYNTADYIANSIKSVLNQTYTDFELIIVDDCSTDSTESVVKSFSDDRIKFLKNERNSGAALSRNRALKMASGKWIAFLDSDDLWEKTKLEEQLNFMESNGYDFSYTAYSEIDQNGNENGVYVKGPKHIGKTGMFNYCWPGCLTVMYNARKIGVIEVADIKKNNDYAMWLNVINKADCYFLNKNLAKYRRGRVGSVSTNGYFSLIKWHYRLFKDALGMNCFFSAFCTFRNLLFGVFKKFFYVKRGK